MERSKGGTRPVCFRMPVEVYADFAAVARLRGVDLTTILNTLCVEARPGLVAERVDWEAAMARAQERRAA